MPVTPDRAGELEDELARFQVLAKTHGIRLSMSPRHTIPDYVLGEEDGVPMESAIQVMLKDGVSEAQLVQTRFDEDLEDDRLEDFLERAQVPADSLLAFAVFWKADGAMNAWDVSTQTYIEAIQTVVDAPAGVIHVDEDFIARMHAKQDAEARESRLRVQQALEQSPHLEEMILKDPEFRSLPYARRGARARDILRQTPAGAGLRNLVINRSLQRSATAVHREAGIVQLCILELGTELARWPGWASGDSRDEQGRQALAYLIENVTQGWHMPKALCDKLVTAARRSQRV